jgi:glycolate oxidase FAD binding subunit
MIHRDLETRLASAAGFGGIVTAPSLVIDGIQSKFVVRPTSPEQVAECLRICSEAGAAVLPAGRMSWLESGNPPSRADVVLSLAEMNRIVEYSPADLTVTVQAGATLEQITEAAAENRQWLPLDPPGGPEATIGATAACASSGPLRSAFGTPRDYVIGMRLAHMDGSESRCGGKVVKNVAGYDMAKLYVGSFGTLAVITELTLKLRPAPERSATLAILATDLDALASTAARILAAGLAPASVVAAIGLDLPVDGLQPGAGVLCVRVMESRTAVESEIERIRAAAQGSVAALPAKVAANVWERITNVDRERQIGIRISLPLARVAETAPTVASLIQGSVMTIDFAAGIVRCCFDSDTIRGVERVREIRSRVEANRGTVTIERAAPEIRRLAGVWGDPGPSLEIMNAIKAAYDPRGLLSPGRFLPGL